MAPAARGLQARLDKLELRDPVFPVVSNVTAKPVSSGAKARDLMVEQLTSPVRWAASVATMVAEGADRFLELGPGSVLCGLNKRNARGVPCTSLGAPADIEAYFRMTP
jgi:[acyl-carrier-protein] S-malonyltransferase